VDIGVIKIRVSG